MSNVPAQPNSPEYNISAISLFTEYNRSTYKQAFGSDAPAFDQTSLMKDWFDPQAAADLQAGADPNEFLPYTVVRLPKPGQPTIGTLGIPRAVAAAVNLLPDGTIVDPNITRAIAKGSIPVPVRALLPNEVLATAVGGQSIIIRRTDLMPSSAADGFTASDRSLLQSIAAKLGA